MNKNIQIVANRSLHIPVHTALQNNFPPCPLHKNSHLQYTHPLTGSCHLELYQFAVACKLPEEWLWWYLACTRRFGTHIDVMRWKYVCAYWREQCVLSIDQLCKRKDRSPTSCQVTWNHKISSREQAREVNNWEITKELSDLPLQADSRNIHYSAGLKIKIILHNIQIIY